MKKVLILTTSTGQGHNQAANSLIDTFTNNGYSCVRTDFLASNSRLLNKVIVKGYEIFASFLPHTYGFFYKLTDNIIIQKILSVFFLNTGRKLKKSIYEFKPDIIIATHPFSVIILHNLKKHGLNIPFISVVTDFKAHYAYISKYVDAYITGSEFTKDSLIKHGIDKNKIFPIGIPINKNFYICDNDIKHIKNDDYFNLLLMSGSMGLKNISYVLDELLNNPSKLRITVVCGNNENLKKDLLKKCQSIYPNKKLHILGFSKEISSLMDYCDVIISKPGGLTVTEAITKNLPLIIPFVIPGQEMENTEFLTENGCAYYVPNIKDINPAINKLIENPELLEGMRNKLKNVSSKYSIDEVINISSNLINSNKRTPN